MTPTRILVVDDHRNTRDALALGLALLGAEVRTAGSGADAMLALEHFACDCLVCDVRMPAMSGIELGERVRAACPHVRVLLMTAYDVSPEEQGRIAAAGAELLIKPVTAETVAGRTFRVQRAG